ncbi:glycosyltransferase family 2 protein [Gillisia sp. CAL575]|uniref:glycosyltransferase family 2 protein n=1 Tax=Gillisia sp. CAL575 TaxID=985255 RepID=UPI0003A13CEA|nr:glycosyltransferase family 2 protein [Gillisia sp. CAL575]
MRISVALCTFNGSQFLNDQLNSILNQSTAVNEIIICDDHSSDNTLEILNEYKDKYPEIIKIFKNEESLGTIKNFEKALTLCTGEIIFLADQDDVWFKIKVQKILFYFKNNSECELVFSDGCLIDSYGSKLNTNLWDKWDFNLDQRNKWKNNFLAFKDLLRNQNKITGATVSMRSSLKTAILPINIPLGYWHDGWIGLHASGRNSLGFIEEPLIYYRIHDKQQVGVNKIVNQEIVRNSNQSNIEKHFFFQNIYKRYPLKFMRLKVECFIYRQLSALSKIKNRIQ